MQKLLAVAASMGLKVVFVKVTGGLQGCYLHERQQIVVAAGLPRALQRETLAHELGHARYGHDCSNPRNEHRAWQHALTLLFGDGAEYAELEQLGFDKFQIAEELDVTVRCVEMRQRTRAFDSKAAAEEFIAELEDDIRSSRYVDPRLAQTPFGEIAAAWLRTKTDVKESTLFRYRTDLQRYVLPKWAHVQVGAITRSGVEQWVSELSAGVAPHAFGIKRKQRPLSAKSVRHLVLVMFAAVLDYAVSHKYVQVSPLVGVRLPRQQQSEVAELPVLTVEQLERVAEHCGVLGGAVQYRVFVQLLGYCGLRIGEATALQVRDLDLPARRITVRRTWTVDKGGKTRLGTPKTGKAREVPVPGFLAVELDTLITSREKTDFIFQTPRAAAISRHNFTERIWRPARKLMGLEHIKIHDLRHTAASLAIKAGADVLIVQRMLGHANATETLNTYSHLFPDKLDEVMERVEALRAESRSIQN